MPHAALSAAFVFLVKSIKFQTKLVTAILGKILVAFCQNSSSRLDSAGIVLLKVQGPQTFLEGYKQGGLVRYLHLAQVVVTEATAIVFHPTPHSKPLVVEFPSDETFVESQNDSKKDPLIFWFNGGPGCSSMDGLLNEMGPYFVNLDGKSLRENPDSWNKMASMVYIESPVGVGYSYSTDGNITSDDDQASLDNYEAIKLFFTNFTDGCNTMMEDIFQTLYYGGLNPYDIYRDCDANPTFNVENMTLVWQGTSGSNNFIDTFKEKTGDALKFLKVSKLLYGDAPCVNDFAVNTYMNDAEVRKTLNIPTDLPRWEICSNEVKAAYREQYESMASFIKGIIAANIRVLLYFGDTDMVCNFLMGQKFSYSLGLEETLGKTPWTFKHQIAGFKTLYKGLTFITELAVAGELPPCIANPYFITPITLFQYHWRLYEVLPEQQLLNCKIVRCSRCPRSMII
ncbi:serine carboxypeptidase [Teladorsagia circumcincta]|uniref:Serine carboxypeptidase n=1 Tax=Teladorsagia circumcincta TaxID=45464 RepID=A0A2G9V4V3_TELCI|nr:serine carboxypeptidase [Teladorsagia circumcincta]